MHGPLAEQIAEGARPVHYGSVCSGIEAATVAWHPLGWRASFVSEIEAFPRAVLQHRWPEIPLHGDFTTIEAGAYEPIDLLVGGTPCQSFSVAGLRGGLDDERGNLALEYLRLARRLRPRWLVWENVPGVLSSSDGRDFGAILGGLVELGYGFAYRILDAQYFGVPQRRRRVFVVGYLGDWRRAAAVLFERESLCGHPPPRREAGQVAAGTLAARAGGGGKPGQGYPAIAYRTTGNDGAYETGDHVGALQTGTDRQAQVLKLPSGGVRRLLPVECERLQGFPDDYTLIPVGKRMAADGPRCKAIGNSMAVPVMAWIGRRIEAVDRLSSFVLRRTGRALAHALMGEA